MRLAKADKRNSLKQKSKTNEAGKLPRNKYGKLSPGAGERWFLREGMCFLRKKMGKSKVLSRGFSLFDSGTEESLRTSEQ